MSFVWKAIVPVRTNNFDMSLYLSQNKRLEISLQNSQGDVEYTKARIWIWLSEYTGECFKRETSFSTYVSMKTIEAQKPKLIKFDLQYSTWHSKYVDLMAIQQFHF